VVPQPGDVVEFPLKLERVAKRGKTQTVSRRKVTTRCMGRLLGICGGGRVEIQLLAYKKLRGHRWESTTNEMQFVKVLMDEVDV
jgi:hypothetical protein